MQWSSVGENKVAIVGFSAKGEFFKNHPQSGTQNIANAVSCPKRRHRRDIDPASYAHLVSTNLCDMPDDLFRLMCLCNSRLDDDIRFRVNEVVNQLYPCPPTLEQAKADTGRFVRQNDDCYVSGKRVIMNGTYFTQQCCYHEEEG